MFILKDLCSITNNLETVVDGRPTKTATTTNNIKCNVEASRGDEIRVGGQVVVSEYIITLNPGTAVTELATIVSGGNAYEVQWVNPIENFMGSAVTIECHCRRLG